MKALREPLWWLIALFIGLLVGLPYSAPLFSRLFPELPRPVYQQESFWALTLDHGWLVVEAEQDPAVAHPLTYARLGYNNLSRLARDAGLI